MVVAGVMFATTSPWASDLFPIPSDVHDVDSCSHHIMKARSGSYEGRADIFQRLLTLCAYASL